MNDLLHPTLERMVTLEINFYCKGKIIGTSMSAVSPNYTAGDTIELQLHPTERDLRRAPRKIERTFYIIDRVHHVIKETGRASRAVLLGLDVLLLEPDDISEDDARTVRQIAEDTIKKRRIIE